MGADTATKDEQAEAAKAAKEAERQAAAEAKEAERKRKEEERAAAKAEKDREKAEAKAKRETERKEKLLKDAGLDPKDYDLSPDGLAVGDVQELAKKKRAEDRANRPKKAPLTLSQRRAMLVLAEAGETGVVPKTGFNALPLDYLVGVELAETFKTTRTEKYQETVENEVAIPKKEQEEGGPTTKTVKEKVDKEREVDATGYRLTEKGRERAGEVNPKWKTWKPDASASADAGDDGATSDSA
jgi:hypothetical protein